MTTESIPLETIQFSEPDIYGQVHPNETEELIAAKIREFESVVEKISDKKKKCLLQAQIRCPELLTDDFKLCFLRCDLFDAKLAAKRWVNYWNIRVNRFGPDRAFGPLTIENALSEEDQQVLTSGVVGLLNGKDPQGRRIMFYDPSKQKMHPRISICRAILYLYHIMMKDEDSMKRGTLGIIFAKNANMSHADPLLDKLNFDSWKGAMPLRASGTHVCHPPAAHAIIFKLVKVFIPPRLLKRILLHQGSQEDVLASLDRFGLTKDILPPQLGGTSTFDLQEQVDEWKRKGL